MKKRIILFMLVIGMFSCIFPTVASAGDTREVTSKKPYYESYTAIGDSICAGFTQVDYEYVNGFDMAENIENSPKLCYARLTGNVLGSTVYNLGKCGCDTNELLDILTDEDNKYYNVYRDCISGSDLITLEIGSDDLIMASAHSILNCIDEDFADMSNQEIIAMVEPLLTGNISGIIDSIELAAGINLNREQIEAIQGELSDESLSATLEEAYKTFCDNFPQTVNEIRAVNSTAEFVILNYYNPYEDMNFNWGNISYNTGKVIQKATDQMNEFTQNYCQNKDYLYVDISDTQTNVVDPHPSTAGHLQITAKIIDGLLNTVTALAQTGGTITPSGIKTAKFRDWLTFSISADTGYEIRDVLVDGESIGSVNTYTFTDIRENHCITVDFQRTDGNTAMYYMFPFYKVLNP